MPESLKNITLRSEEVQDILTKVPHWIIRWGNLLFLCLILMTITLSWFIKYPDIINTEAIVTTTLPPQKEYAKITGKLSAILVEDNQIVTNNQPLGIIENTANYNDVFTLKSIVDTITVNSTSFKFPIDNIPLLFLGDIETTYALFENSYIQYQLNKELKPFNNEALANTFSISELNRQLSNLQTQKTINKSELNFSKKDLQRNKTLFEKGVISARDYENKQLEVAQAERNYKNFEASISQLRERISNAHSNTKSITINKTKEDMVLLKNVIQSFNQLKKAIKDWEYKYVLQSNINGKVAFLNYRNTNQTVNQGDMVFSIIPNESTSYIAKLKAPTLNSGKIKIGQTVNIKLENYPDAEFGILKGTIKNISLIPDKEGFYLINVELPKTLITTYNKTIEFKQEMQSTAEIITEDLRLTERLFYEFRDIFNRHKEK